MEKHIRAPYAEPLGIQYATQCTEAVLDSLHACHLVPNHYVQATMVSLHLSLWQTNIDDQL